jgi:hypothetical protein
VTANADGATMDSATKIEWRADRSDGQPLSKPQIYYAVHLVKGSQGGVTWLDEYGSVKTPLRLRPIVTSADDAPPGPTK